MVTTQGEMEVPKFCIAKRRVFDCIIANSVKGSKEVTLAPNGPNGTYSHF